MLHIYYNNVNKFKVTWVHLYLIRGPHAIKRVTIRYIDTHAMCACDMDTALCSAAVCLLVDSLDS